MYIRTTRRNLAIMYIIMGVLTLIIPNGWSTAPLTKLGVAAFFIGFGCLGLRRR
jgi:hypothetical protein